MNEKLNFKSFILNTLDQDLKIKKLNEIQVKTIPYQLKNKNVIGVSSTGSGKTLAFLLPILQKIELNNNLQSLIILPTRELARQIYNVLMNFKKNEPNLKFQLFVGGNEYEKQLNAIKSNKPQIIIATIDRIKKTIIDKSINYTNLKIITIDEADMLSDLGFINDLDFILTNINVDNNIQVTSWSASLHDLLIHKLKVLIKNPTIIKVGKSIYDNKNINHHVILNNDANQSLNVLINKINPYLCLIFANNKKAVEEYYKFLKNNNLDIVMLHASLSPRERKTIFNKIKHFDYQYIIASDLASRGIDINGVSDVISLGLPNEIEWYIHRAGRTGRGKYTGNSWVLINENDIKVIKNLRSKGIDFKFYKIKNNSLVSIDYNLDYKRNILDEQAKKEIKQFNTKKANNKKVKPNYKKKQKDALNKIKQKSKRRYIDQKIKSIINKKEN